MKFLSRAPEELSVMNLLPEGDYDFFIESATDKVSKTSGKEMIALILQVYNGSQKHTVYDYLVGNSDAGLCMLKISNFCECVGIGQAYTDGEINADSLFHLTGRVRIKIENDVKYGSKNVVDAYIIDKPSMQDDLMPF
jgi:hypothetical protein